MREGATMWEVQNVEQGTGKRNDGGEEGETVECEKTAPS